MKKELLHYLYIQGYEVSTTVRSLKKKEKVIEMLSNAGAKNLDKLIFLTTFRSKSKGIITSFNNRGPSLFKAIKAIFHIDFCHLPKVWTPISLLL